MKDVDGLTVGSADRVSLDGGLLGERLDVNREQTVPTIHQQLKKTGALHALAASQEANKKLSVHPFWDSDIAKWLEAGSYSLAAHPDPGLEFLVDEVIFAVVRAQEENGYFNTYYTIVEPENRFKLLAFGHELYNAGHMIEAAVAHHAATGKRTLLNVATRYADLIVDTFGPRKRNGYPGHPEIELALVKLYRVTQDRRYLEMSRCFIERRGRKPSAFEKEKAILPPAHLELFKRFFGSGDSFSTAYCQDHLPVLEQTEATGHAVRAMYLYAAMVDVSVETGDENMLETCRRLWHDVASRRMYVTGGIGSSKENEGFTAAHDLPNNTAYAETCAAIGLALFSHRLLQIGPNSIYADVMERSLYNAILGGASLDGKRFFYDNPLESKGAHHRQEWFEVACCPPNWSRFIASLGRYVYSKTNRDIYVHLYANGQSELQLGAERVVLRQETEYPWDGRVTIRVEPDGRTEFGLNLRIPGWTRSTRVQINGEPLDIPTRTGNGYVRMYRRWRVGDVVNIEFPMPIEKVYAHPAVEDDIGRVALQRGPLVYCLEQVDHSEPIHQIAIGVDDDLRAECRPDLLGGMVVITGTVRSVNRSDWPDTLYRTARPATMPCTLTAVPFYSWDNRSPGAMQVWTRYRDVVR